VNDWIEVFRAGKHTDSQGRQRTWTRDDLDKMVNGYDPTNHEAPIVVGHPKSNAPAYGWVEALKRSGERLLAKFKQVEQQFGEMVQAGRFKKRSISVYPNGTLRHVGFLGAAPPAIPGLKDIDFNDEDNCLDYEQPIQDEEYDMTKEELEQQLEEQKKKTAAAEKKAADFEQRANTATANFEELESKNKKAQVDRFIADGINSGKIIPAWKDQGLADFMLNLEEDSGEYEFSEGKKQTQATWFREFLEGFSSHPLFKQMVKPQENTNQDEADFEEEEKLAQEMADMVNPAE